MRKLVISIVAVALISTITPSQISSADTGGSCSVNPSTNLKLGNDYIPKSPGAYLAAGSTFKISDVKLEGIRATYASSTEISIAWSRWEVLDQAKETLFYDRYVLFYSSDNAVSWRCSTISTALFWFTLGGLEKDTDYKFAMTATDGSIWAAPTYFEASTNFSKRPIFQRCLPTDLSPTIDLLSSSYILIRTKAAYGNNLPVKWLYSENRWKSTNTYKNPYRQTFIPVTEVPIIPISRKAVSLDIRLVPAAEKIPQESIGVGYSGNTSKGCKPLNLRINLAKKAIQVLP